MIKVFKYLDELNCFVVDPHYKKIADYLGLTEWNEVVWIGRFFILDNDYGEHWFDNWELRRSLEARASELGLDSNELLILDPDRFKNGVDGPRHTSEQRISFWKDVLLSLQLSHETLFNEARKLNREREKSEPKDYISDLEQRIITIQNEGA